MSHKTDYFSFLFNRKRTLLPFCILCSKIVYKSCPLLAFKCAMAQIYNFKRHLLPYVHIVPIFLHPTFFTYLKKFKEAFQLINTAYHKLITRTR